MNIGPGLPLVGISPKDCKATHRTGAYVSVFIVALQQSHILESAKVPISGRAHKENAVCVHSAAHSPIKKSEVLFPPGK